jgi:hypothetical protein
MSAKTPWVFVDCEARGTSAVHGVLTEFGAVHYDTRDTFHGDVPDGAVPGPGRRVVNPRFHHPRTYWKYGFISFSAQG